ncbi:MAG: HAD family hydrolase [Acidimicrobiales bacterium]
MIKALLLDFYGTVVHEDDIVMTDVCQQISKASPLTATVEEIDSYWWSDFSNRFMVSHGERFQTQRNLELASLDATCSHFNAACDVPQLCETIFAYWQTPPLFDDARDFLSACDLPIMVLSNIDRVDIEAAIAAHGLAFRDVITSEDVRSYKPRPELFQAGLDALGLAPTEVLHVGDSVTSDVIGANELGIPVAWVNRNDKATPAVGVPDFEVSTLTELNAIL